MPDLEPLTQKIVLQASAPEPMLGGLDATIAKLERAQTLIAALNSASEKGAMLSSRSGTAFTSQIKTTGEQSTKELAKLFGFTPEEVTAYGAKLQAEASKAAQDIQRAMEKIPQFTPKGKVSKAYQAAQKELEEAQRKVYFTSSTAQTLKSPRAAGAFFEEVEKKKVNADNAIRAKNNELLKAALGGGATATGAAGIGVAGAKVTGGKIEIEIPASQFSVKVMGNLEGQVVSGRDPATGKFSGGGGGGSGGGGGGGGGKKGGGGVGEPFNPPASPSELSRRIRESESGITTSITELDGVGKQVTKTYDEVGEQLSKEFRSVRKSPLMEKVKDFDARMKANLAGLKPGDLLGEAAEKEAGAAHLNKLITPEVLKMAQGSGIASSLTRRAGIMAAQAATLRATAQQSAQLAAGRVSALMGTPLNYSQFIQATLGPQPMAPHAQRQAYYQSLFGGGVPPVIGGGVPPIIKPPKPPRAGKGGGPLNKWRDFSLTGLVANVGVMAGWSLAMAPVMAARKGIEFMVEKTVELEMQTARLQNVFRGTGGTVQQLSQDILQLAAANGADTAATMETATAWARLGMSRSQVGVATQQTAMLSNIGQVPQEQVQSALQSIMANYKLKAAALPQLAAMFTVGGERTGTPMADLLAGVAKAAPMAAIGGMSPAELMAIIGVGSRMTHDTGMRTGMTMQAIFQALATPEMREYYAEEYGISPTDKKGQPVSLSQMWKELAGAYAGASPIRRAQMLRVGPGALRSSRFGEYLEGYSEEQRIKEESLANPKAAVEAQGRLLNTIAGGWGVLKATATSVGGQIMEREPAGHGVSLATMMSLDERLLAKGIETAANIVLHPVDTYKEIGRRIFPLTPEAQAKEDERKKAEAAKDKANGAPDITNMRSSEDEEEAERYFGQRQEVINYLRERKELLEGIVKTTQELETVGEEGKFLSRRESLEAQAESIHGAIQGLDRLAAAGTANPDELKKAYESLFQERMETQGELSAVRPGGPLEKLEDNREQRRIGRERGGEFAEEAGLVGHTPLAQMVNRGAAIGDEIGRLQGMPVRGPMDSARLLELLDEQYKNRVAEGHRTEELDSLQKQNRQEAQRTFARETLFAGPQELLQRIGIMKLAQSNGGRGIGARDFFALSSEGRRMYDEFKGGDSGAKLREEARIAKERGLALTPEEEYAKSKEAQDAMAATRKEIDRQNAPAMAQAAQDAALAAAAQTPSAVAPIPSKPAPTATPSLPAATTIPTPPTTVSLPPKHRTVIAAPAVTPAMPQVVAARPAPHAAAASKPSPTPAYWNEHRTRTGVPLPPHNKWDAPSLPGATPVYWNDDGTRTSVPLPEHHKWDAPSLPGATPVYWNDDGTRTSVPLPEHHKWDAPSLPGATPVYWNDDGTRTSAALPKREKWQPAPMPGPTPVYWNDDGTRTSAALPKREKWQPAPMPGPTPVYWDIPEASTPAPRDTQKGVARQDAAATAQAAQDAALAEAQKRHLTNTANAATELNNLAASVRNLINPIDLLGNMISSIMKNLPPTPGFAPTQRNPQSGGQKLGYVNMGSMTF